MKKMICLLLALVVCLLAGCHDTTPTVPGGAATQPSSPSTAPTQTTAAPTDPNGPYINETWDMQAVLVDDKGEVLESAAYSVLVQIYDEDDPSDEDDRYVLRFFDSEDYNWCLTGMLKYREDDEKNNMHPYTIGYSHGNKKGDFTGLPYFCYHSFNLEKQCFIMDMDDDKDVYLIVYKDPGADIAGLWDYFQNFIERVPHEWPEFSVGP